MLCDIKTVKLKVTNVTEAVFILILVRSKARHLFAALTNTLKNMTVAVSFCQLIGIFICFVIFKILIIVLCLHQSIAGYYLVSVFVRNNATNVPISVTSICGNYNCRIGAVKDLTLCGVLKKSIFDSSESVMIIAHVPRVSKLSLAVSHYAEMSNICLVMLFHVTAHVSAFGILRLYRDLNCSVGRILTN